MMSVGKMISTIRKERRLSQAQLAELVGISKQAISNYERGEREPDYVTLEAIADALNVAVSMLISRERQQQALDAIYNAREDQNNTIGYATLGPLTISNRATLTDTNPVPAKKSDTFSRLFRQLTAEQQLNIIEQMLDMIDDAEANDSNN